jgi:hypothetical protein
MRELNAMAEEMSTWDWAAIDRQINKDTGTWKRVQAIFGTPRSEETKLNISLALTGHHVSARTRQKISASLRKFHAKRRKGGIAGPGKPATPEVKPLSRQAVGPIAGGHDRFDEAR